MSSRYFNTKFWRDHFVDNLDPSEKLLFIYLFTNPEATTTGIYEIPKRMISSDTGFVKEMVDKLFSRLSEEKKAFYIDGWVCTTNTISHQNLKNKFIVKGIENDLQEIGDNIISKFYELGDQKFKNTIDKYFYKIDEEKENLNNIIVPIEEKQPIELKKPKVKKLRNIIPPTLEMVQKYKAKRIAEKIDGAKSIDPQSFINHYDANGWIRGKTKIKDWCACFRTWESNRNFSNNNSIEYNPRGNDALRRQKKEEEYRDELRQRNENSESNDRLKKLREQSQLLSANKTV